MLLLFQYSTMTHRRHAQFFWQDDMIGVASFYLNFLDVMLGADSDNQSQASDQLRWLELM
jgi:hypothetical protein